MGQRHQRREIERLLRRRRRQGLTYRELSEESGIPTPTLSWWARKLVREREEGEEQRLVAVEVVEDGHVKCGAPIEIIVAGRVTIVVPEAVTDSHLERVLRAVASC